jgi:transcriptional regulator with XRE-family HTH domain
MVLRVLGDLSDGSGGPILRRMPPRRQLAARRKAVGHSQESLANQIDVSAQSVARWEQGTSTPLARYRRPLAEHLSISLPELELLIDGASESAVPAGSMHAVPGWLDHYASLEQAAARLQTFEPISLPGLLQTPAYAEAVVRTNWIPLPEQVVKERVNARLARQKVLSRRPDPLELHCVIDESALYRVTGSEAVMADQLRHLCDVLQRKPTVRLQVCPARSSALHTAAFGSFGIFTSADPGIPYMVCTEDLTGFNYLDRRPVIEAHAQLFDHLTRVALSPEDSADLTHEIAETYQ